MTFAQRALLGAAISFSGMTAPAFAQGGCHPASPTIRSDKGVDFVADAYARPVWRERASGGRRLDYARTIWRGRINGRVAYLTFDEIPGTSGPNHHMDYRLARLKAKPVWRANAHYDLGERFIVLSGPLAGEWTVRNC